MNNKIYKCSAWLVFLAISVWAINIGSYQISQKAQAQEADGVSLLVAGETSVPAPVMHGTWCSALYGAFSSTTHLNNEVINVDGLGDVDLSDSVTLAIWYAGGNDAACRARFEPTPGQFNFDQSNYLNIDWCMGLKQGVTDTIGAHAGDAKFSPIFDLNHDGVINLTDTVMMVQYLSADNQEACYIQYVPPMPSWPAPDIVAPVIMLLGGNPINLYVGDAYIDAGATALDNVDGDISANIIMTGAVSTSTIGTYILTYNVSDTASNPAIPVTRTVDVIARPLPPAPTPSSGGGGGGYIPINIFNVQVTPGTDNATITWQTSRNSVTWMFYGLDIALETENKDSVYKSTHTIDLSNLKPGTTYHYQLRAQDSGGNTVYDVDRTFATLSTTGGIVPQVLGTKEVACVPKIDKDIKNITQFANGKLIRSCGSEVYLLVQGKKYHVVSWQDLHDNFFGKRIYNVSEEVLNSYPDFVGSVKGVKLNQ